MRYLQHHIYLCIRIAVVAIALVSGGASTANASSNLQQELAIVAEEISKFLKARDEHAIALGQFTAPPQLAASGGSGIAHILTDELKKREIEVKPRAALGIEGKFRDVEDSKSKKLAAEITVNLVDRAGQIVLSLVRGVFGDATLAGLLGITTELPPAANDQARDAQLRQGLDAPQAAINNTRVAAAANSPFSIEVLVKSGEQFQARAAQNDGGLAFIPIKRDEIYAIKLNNDSDNDAAVLLTIDGVNVFAFSENKQYTQFVIPAKKSGVIKGWHRNNNVSDSFLVTELAKGAAAELKQPSNNIGTITAAFSAAWENNPPADEPPNPNQYSRSADATGRGPQVEAKYSEVARQFGVVRATVSVRYTK